METKKIGKLEIKIGISKKIEKKIVEKLEEFLSEKWLQAVMAPVKHPWWSIKNLGIPSLLVRVDMAPPVLNDNDKVDLCNLLYEVEVRPGGIGLALSLFLEKGDEKRVGQWQTVLRECKGLVNIRSSIQDDRLAAQILGLPYFEDFSGLQEGPYWIRTDQRNVPEELEKISLVPIREDGDKSYLVKLDLAEEIIELECLNWSKPFIIKPRVGTRMEGVEIYLPNALRKEFLGNGVSGVSTQSRIKRTLEKKIPYLVQPFIPPQKEEIEGKKGYTIWRIFFGWNNPRQGYCFLGGLWNWRPNLRIHGASDAVFGLLM